METAVLNSTTVKKSNFKSEEYFINMGPQHPATHGVLRLLLTIDGEIIKKVEPDLGYIHRSIEKMSESNSYQQIVHLTDRLDYLSSHINNEAVCLCVENALELEVPERVKVIRTILGELTRIASHTLWWGVMGMDVGALTTYFYGFRDREMINDIFEETCGARLTMNYNIPGGLMQDIHPNFVKRVKEFIPHFRSKLPEYDRLLTGNIIFQKRTKGVGVLSREDAINFGASGPVARASGYSCDVRKYHPYSALDKVNFTEALDTAGDSFARYKVRIAEMWESLNIIEQLIDNIPEGDFKVATNAVIKLPKGDFYQKVETARGEFGVYIISTGNKNPYRVKFRSPGLSNLSLLNHIAVGGKIGDLVATMATIDIVVPDIDR
ncbi:MAG: NADH-quinone oxidoreductase subunit D [Salinimicrobium sediminis]|uniref:NADH-quinone oxidoreductase subunit D n=1 Tax=Salinimicrobium sediminis TaxID=1343891 RepID=A0A285X879_9FLAO|nr:NADH-quinone oxidoreductase subunit D [Salinimicrobium sediminis]MDX1602141.1 NADH-quinone oxidoreductase subunit D [Salinimicrobium sediminis]SOC81522.1 NADH-quinone oxidoreductase subunit D/NADH-quinone oxidoreductase subunit C/D [Salinimicrobium sediminis]